ncbi:hypothetical protein BU24DRAFT_431357 [Aaosphaeria arxii CBS 175.79]|uniref:Aminoglycoside phosphotransferase domain-containing protein n=1 Tax=Aaosphaeria arxii CBS 175.79 TaxID=1450172 RepID=A0A6A5Y314_9PLEO|nr:uncharacterized protein BU24DRAFT_431357 [Aaosphaeria arxii CBS 175.79]KAF2019623.1 hypothetical protein BU24DRAFT_431357 [Aaosphaeria arxii CBS 175.79]
MAPLVPSPISSVNSERPKTWKNTDINQERLLKSRKQLVNYDDRVTCELSSEYKMGGINAVRRLDFDDGTSWVARVQMGQSTPESLKRKENASIFGYGFSPENPVGVGFMVMELIAGDSAMDMFGGWLEHKGRTPLQFKERFHSAMARVQVEMASIRFPKIGSIIRLTDGTYDVGPIPKLGGPFDYPADFFSAWAKHTKYPYTDALVRERTPPEVVNEVLSSIKEFPSRLTNLAKNHCFEQGPFPLFHTDIYKSNIIIDSEYNLLSVIDWENAIAVPWELVEFIKDLCIVPPAMDGPLYHEEESDRQAIADRKVYVKMVRKVEEEMRLDNRLSSVLGNEDMQNLANAIWLYQQSGRIGFYTGVLEPFE